MTILSRIWAHFQQSPYTTIAGIVGLVGVIQGLSEPGIFADSKRLEGLTAAFLAAAAAILGKDK